VVFRCSFGFAQDRLLPRRASLVTLRLCSGQAGFVRNPGDDGHNLLASRRGRSREAPEGFAVSSAERLNISEGLNIS